ncbi:NLGN [Acanthosepion pharaonis]|uniref:NLGN n=1 Tax=Acanthosepion pharaonis TaxID=158019 RepID=A0A812BWY7_ACAPH|nr:NLGN [Sepia pharaonis]
MKMTTNLTTASYIPSANASTATAAIISASSAPSLVTSSNEPNTTKSSRKGSDDLTKKKISLTVEKLKQKTKFLLLIQLSLLLATLEITLVTESARAQDAFDKIISERIIETKYGKIRGVQILFRKDLLLRPVDAYLGIPYASFRKDAMRFMPPGNPPFRWDGTSPVLKRPPRKHFISIYLSIYLSIYISVKISFSLSHPTTQFSWPILSNKRVGYCLSQHLSVVIGLFISC